MSKQKQYMSKLGELLVFHRVINEPEELTENNFDEIVMEFQDRADILMDGDPDEETLWALQYPWALQAPKMLFERCEADLVPDYDGFDNLTLRSDAAERYRKLRRTVKDLSGVITTAGGKRPLSAQANASRSAKSMHYPGLAFDLSTTSGFFKPEVDPYVITRGDEANYWIVWCRAHGGQDMEFEAVYWKNWNSGVDLKTIVQDKFINFTELCIEHGFYPIKPRQAFLRQQNRKYLSSEWWHFQANDLLIPNLSQFGIELLKIEDYTRDYIISANENIWSNRKVIFKKSWL